MPRIPHLGDVQESGRLCSIPCNSVTKINQKRTRPQNAWTLQLHSLGLDLKEKYLPEGHTEKGWGGNGLGHGGDDSNTAPASSVPGDLAKRPLSGPQCPLP